MISYLKGNVIHRGKESATVLAHDSVGYEVWIPENDLKSLSVGKDIELFCYHHINDRTQELYGFRTRERRELFALLITHVNGVGPKSALKLLAKIESVSLERAVAQGNALILEQCGVGTKTAEKIISGLRGKLEKAGVSINPSADSSAYREAYDALLTLGYTKLEVQHSLSEIDVKEKSAENIIKEALRSLG